MFESEIDITYAFFLILFLCLPLILLTVWLRHALRPRLLILLGVLALVAVVYTGPWDNAIIENGVWSYGNGRVFGLLIGRVPVEEYAFYVLQVCLTGLLTAGLIRRRLG
ncbi:MAG: lycopene cyclase domain-containing protein [Chloroflexi bacterium]|nr:MAG: lycopene cyclase domain-containing protein [Chloroflexota bacterium]